NGGAARAHDAAARLGRVAPRESRHGGRGRRPRQRCVGNAPVRRNRRDSWDHYYWALPAVEEQGKKCCLRFCFLRFKGSWRPVGSPQRRPGGGECFISGLRDKAWGSAGVKPRGGSVTVRSPSPAPGDQPAKK